MTALKSWLLGVVLTALAGGLAQELAPGERRAAVRAAAGLLLILSLLRPLTDLAGKWELPSVSEAYGSSEAWAEEDGKNRRSAFSALIEEKTEAYIWDKADRLGLDCTVEVACGYGGSGLPLPERVTITGAYSEALSALIAEEVGIPAGRQIWLEE